MTQARTRMRPASREESQETRTAGATVSENVTTAHKPVAKATVQMAGSGLIARVTVKDGITLNMGNFNSFRRDIGLEVDIPLESATTLAPDGALLPEVEARLEKAYESIQQFVSDLVSDAAHDARQYFEDLD